MLLGTGHTICKRHVANDLHAGHELDGALDYKAGGVDQAGDAQCERLPT